MEMDEIRGQKGPTVSHISNQGDPESPSTDSYQQAGQQVQMAADAPEPKVSLSTILAVFFMGLSYVPAISAGLLLPTGILQQIGQQLGDTENIIWIPGGWSVASAVAFSIAGGLSDVFGRRWVLMAGQLFTLIGGVAAGTTIIGFGAGTIFVGYPGISELLPNKYRGIGLGWTEFCINIPWGALSVYLATQLLIHATWRWCFYIAIIYAVICIAGTFVCYFPPSRPQHDFEKSRWQEFKELDFIGLALFTAGLCIFLVGMTDLGHANFSVPLVASTISIGAVIFVSSFWYDFTKPKNPIFPFKLFAMFREFTVHLIILFISGMVWQAIVTLAPQITLYAFTNDPIEIGITMIPSTMSGVLGGWIIPSFVHKIKHVRYQIIFALLMQCAFTASYAAVVPSNRMAWSAMQLFGQCCFTWVTTLAYVSSGLFVPVEELGVSAGLLGTFRSAGGSVGNAIFSTIMTSVANKNLGNNLAGAAIGAGFDPANLTALIPAVIQNAVGVPFAFDAVPGITPAVIAATGAAFKETYANAFRMVCYATIPFCMVATAVAFWVKDPSHLLNNHVAVQQEKEVLSGVERRPEAVVGKRVDDNYKI
ncbi:fungal trichothecene efflux pump [Diaporthe sp. PMI_573]|nr:fungal trichothecene efflux pump [Diaporthaceae sp. PMI_573]